MSGQPSALSGYPVAVTRDQYKKLRRKLKESFLYSFHINSDAKVLDKHIDLSDVHYREQRASEVALAHLLLKEFRKSGIVTDGMLHSVEQLRDSLRKADSIKTITSGYISVLKEVEFDLAQDVLQEEVEEILWTYIFEPTTENGAANRSRGKHAPVAGDEHDEPAHSISSGASRLSTQVATAVISRAVTKLQQDNEGKAAHKARSRYRRQREKAIINGRYHPESRLSQTTNVSYTDDPLPTRDASDACSSDGLSTSTVATTATHTASTAG